MGVFDEKAIDILHFFWPSHNNDKLYIGRVDMVTMPDGSVQYQATISYGAAKRPRLTDQPKGRFNTLREAATVINDKLQEKLREGYKRVGDYDYEGRMTWAQCLTKVDTSFTVGFVQQAAKSASIATPVATGRPLQPPHNHGGRANRKVQV